MTYTITPIPALKDNYIWAITYQNKTLIVDPGIAEPVLHFLKNNHYQLVGILLTHHHWDHTNGAAALQKQFSVPLIGAKNTTIAGVTETVSEGDIVKLSHFPLTFQVLEIKGHTLDHLAFYADNILFTGDTLFAAGCGRVFEGTLQEMYDSLQKLARLPDDTNIYCGHEYTLNNLRFAKMVEPNNLAIANRMLEIEKLRADNQPSLPSNLAAEKATNPFLRCNSTELISNVSAYAKQTLSDPVEIFRWVRAWKDGF